MHKQRIFILIAAVLGIAAVFLPWKEGSASYAGITRSVSINGIDYDNEGWFALALFVLAAIFTLVGDRKLVLNRVMKKAVAGAGAGALAYMIVVLLFLGISMSGSGVFISLLAAALIMTLPIIIQGDGSFEMTTQDSLKNDLNN